MSIGQVYYDVLPNLDGFAAKVAAGIGTAKPVKIKVDADTAGVESKLKGATGATGSLLAAQNRLASAQGTARVAALRHAEAQAKGIAGSARVVSAYESQQRALRGLAAAQANLEAKSAAPARQSLSSKINTNEVQQVGTNFLRAGAAIGVGVGLAVRASANFEQAMSGVASTGNYTSGQLGLLSKAAIAQGQATQFSATEAAQGEAELVKAGLNVQQVLGGGLAGALNLAAAGNMSVADSASAAATAINQFGLQGSDATHVADRFVQIAGIAQGETSDVADAFKNGAVAAHAYGLSIDDASALTGLYAKNGILGAQAGTLMKSSLTNLYAPSAKAEAMMKRFGITTYDTATGAILPLNDVAQQLQDRLGGLDDAARNNALKTIFGKEQLQGGILLMQAGGKGLAGITAELDKFPTAAQTAATKMDNLKGDVEQLSGSLETAFIQSGSGSTSILRDLTQGTTAAINGFSGLPGAVQKGALGFAAISSVSLLAGGSLIKLVSAATTAKVALDTLGASGSALPGRLAGIGKAIGVTVAAFALLQGLGRGDNALFGGATTNLGDAGQAIAGLGKNAAGATPAIDKFFTFTSNQDLDFLNNQVNGLGDAFRHVDQGGGKVAGVLNGISGALGFTTQAQQVSDRFGQLDTVLTQMGTTSAPQAAAGFTQLADAAAKQHVPVEKLVALFPQYKAQLQDQATALGVTVPDSAQVYADWMGGKIPDAVLAAAKANPQLAGSMDIVNQATDESVKGFATAEGALRHLIAPQKIGADAAQALSTKLFGSAQAALSASQAQIAYAQAVRQAKASTGGGIDPKSDKGASNLSLLNQQAGAYQAVASAQIAAGKSAGSVAAGAQKARDAFIANAKGMGVSGDAAKALADKYGLIPKNIKVKIEEQVQKNAEDELTKLKALDGTIITPKIQALIDQGKYKQALAALKKVQADRRAKVKAEAANTPEAKRKLDQTAKTRAAKLKAQAERVGSEAAKLDKAAKARKAALKAQAEGTGGAGGKLDKTAHPRTATITARANTASANAALNAAARHREATITVKTNDVTGKGATGGTFTGGDFVGRGPKGYSIGGSVWGAGTSTSDGINARLANGEEVIRTTQADRNRAILKRINAGGTWDIVPKMARGGTKVPKVSTARADVAQATTTAHRPIVINVDLGPELGGIRTIVADEVNAQGEYAATLTRMGRRR